MLKTLFLSLISTAAIAMELDNNLTPDNQKTTSAY